MNKYKWFSNPFHYLAGPQALITGLVLIALTAVFCVWGGVHLDGVIDAHYGKTQTFPLAVAEGLINFLLLTGVLIPLAYVIGKPGFRLIDLIGTQALARAPYLLVAIIMLIGSSTGLPEMAEFANAAQPPSGTALIKLLGFGLATVLMSVWSIYLMYRSFAFCTNAKTSKAVACFIVGLVIAEVISKIIYIRLL